MRAVGERVNGGIDGSVMKGSTGLGYEERIRGHRESRGCSGYEIRV